MMIKGLQFEEFQKYHNRDVVNIKRFEEGLEDSKGAIKIRKSKKDKQYNDKVKTDKRANIIYTKTIHRKLKMEQHEPH